VICDFIFVIITFFIDYKWTSWDILVLKSLRDFNNAEQVPLIRYCESRFFSFGVS